MRNQFLILTILLFCIGSAQATVVYQEDFEDGYANGITDLTGTWAVAENGLNGSVYGYHGSWGNHIFTLDDVLSNNVAVDADFKISNGETGDFEIWVNATIKDSLMDKIESGYVIKVQPNGGDNWSDVIARIDPGTGGVTLDNNVTGQFLVGSENHLRVERFGDTINVILNGTPYLNATDSTYQNGSIGFRLFNEGVVDNIVVTPEPATMVLLGLGALVLRRKRRA